MSVNWKFYLIGLLLVYSTVKVNSQTNTWNGSVNANWNTAGNWSLNLVPTSSHNVVIPDNFSLTVNTAAVCNSFTINSGSQPNSITISGTNSLTVTNAVTIGAGNGSGDHKLINVGTGTLSCASVTVTATGNANRNSGITVSTGTVNVSGNITMNDANDVFTFSGAGTLNIGGTISGGTLTASTGTVNYNNSGNQNIGAYTYYNLTLSGGGTKTLSGAVTVGGTYTNNDASITLACGASNLTLNGPVTNSGLLTTGNNTVTYGGTGSQTLISANYNNLTVSGARTVNSVTYQGNIGVAATFNPSATFTTGSSVVTGSTIDFNGDAAQNVPAFTYYNLTISNRNSASTTARTKTQTGIITVNGNFNINGLAAGIVTFALANFNFTVSGTSGINAYGSLTDSGASTNTFAGNVTIDTNGRWNVPQPCVFRNGLTNNSTNFTAGSTYTFDTNDQAINGTAAITLAAVVTGTAGRSLTNANSSGLTITGLLSGAGNFINGTVSVPSVLTLTSTGDPFSLTGTLYLSTNVNTVVFSSTGAQTVDAIDYYNLTISGSRGTNSVTFPAGTTGISGTFSPASTFSSGNYIIAGTTFHFKGSSAQSIPSLGTAGYNNVTVSGGSTKSLIGNVNLGSSGVLTLGGAVIDLGSYNLLIANNAAAAIVAGSPYGPANMISTGGTGYLQKSGSTSAGFQIVYPVGSAGYYSPVTLSTLGTVIPTYIRVRAVPETLNPNYISKYWDIRSDFTLNNTTATFSFDAAELNGASNNVTYSPDYGVNWQNPPASGSPSYGLNSFTISGTNPFTGFWSMGFNRTYYSYQNGNWSDPTTWTSDPSGTLQVGNFVPGTNDVVNILTGRIVTLSGNVPAGSMDLTLSEGAILDLGAFSLTGTLNTLSGQGTLRLSSTGFPLSTTNNFVATGGGTTEYMAGLTLPVAQVTYNNLKINAVGTVIQVNNLTLNGNLDITRGTFQINDNTAARRQLTVMGNVTVSSGASFTVGTGVTNTTVTPTGIGTALAAPFINYYDSHSHRVVFLGNFTNNGTVRFTNLNYPVYNQFPPIVNGPTSGFATVYFRGSSNNTLTCNGTTDFYSLVLDKGTDQTNSLTITSSAYSNFRLFGANIAGGDQTAPATATNPNLKKALWIRTGSLVLRGSIVIPSLSEGNEAAAASLNYIIPGNGALVIDGADVIVQTTAELYEEINAAYGVSGGTGTVNGVIAGPNESGLLVFGKLEMNGGYLSTKESRGLLYSSGLAGQVFINGGTVDTKQVRSLIAGSGLISFSQTGGVMEIRGRFQRTPSAYTGATDLADAPVNTVRLNDAALLSTVGSFSIENSNDIFTMTGGTINIYDVPAAGATSRAYDILTTSSNYNVTGGSLVFIPTTGTGGSADATAWLVSTAAPAYNFTVNRASGASSVQINTGYPLTVRNNLMLQTGVLNANGLDLTIGGNFTVSAGTTYTSGANTTVFNGTSAQSFTINLASALTINNMRVDKNSGVALNLAGSQATLNLNGTFSLYTGTFNDNGSTVNVGGNVYNSGVHTGSGRIVLNGAASQSIDGSGTGIFNNLELNNASAASAPVSLANNIIINGTLTFSQNKLFNIGTRKLTLSSTATIAGASSLRYIQTSGAAGDGGLSMAFPGSVSLTYPVGVSNYTPATIAINGTATAYGSVTVVPVNYTHPNVTSAGRSLSYFWRVTSAGFSLGSATVTHGYQYNQANVVTGAGVSENEYVGARYNPSTYTWSSGTSADVDESLNIIGEPGTGSFLESVDFIDGDYTAGDNNPTSPFGTPQKYYSRQSGAWGTTTSWSLTSHTVTNTPASPPGANDIVIIGNGHTISFGTPGGYQNTPNTDPHSCASLQIEAGSTLDIRFNPASVFSMVMNHPSGNGTIRIAANSTDGSTFMFPAGDFSDFNRNLGTTELYSTNPGSGTTYWLPNGVTSYGNLVISPLGGSNIIFPNNDLLVFGDLIMMGQNADSWFCPTWTGDYPTAPTTRVSKTITVDGDLDIRGGSFIWIGSSGGGAQNIVVNGDVIVAPWAGIDVYSPNASQAMSIGGSLINNSTNQIAPTTSTLSYVNLTQVPLTFFGSNNASITNTAGTPRTDFGLVTVNKGTSQATTLTIDVGGTLNTLTNAWLTLQNGTLRYMRTNPAAGANFNISTTTPFAIPATAGLYIDYANANNTSILIGNSNNNNGDLQLSGKLTLVRGLVYVGQVAAPNNHNDIEYTGSGASEIDIQGGSLYVNGSIKRQGTSGGILRYSQGGSSTVTIGGRGGLVTNGKFELLNPGSSFSMSGTSTLTIQRGGGTSSFGDIYLRPESASVTGGTIIVQPPTTVTAAESTFKTDVAISLNNFTITGFGAGGAANVSLSVNPLVLAGNLVITNATSSLVTNDLGVTIGGDFTNSGTYTYGNNTTVFNGNAQSILGTTVTNFNNMTVSPVTSLSVNNNFTVNGNLSITRGTLILGSRRLTLLKNITNDATYTDDNVNGGVYLNGSILQQIYGTGSFGRLVLNNALGARTNNDLTIQNNLELTLGLLDISSNRLTLGVNSQIGGAPFSATKMIVSDGVISSGGLRKFFNTIAVRDTFYFPVGVSEKYTPATYFINANGSVGYINVSPVNCNHPGVLDEANVLNYYWAIESSGISGFNGSLLLGYDAGDVSGTESDYIAARLLSPGTFWSKATPGPSTDNVNEVTHEILFQFPAGSDNLSGDFTAGIDSAIPDEVPSYITVSDGDWSDRNIWAPVGSAPACPVGGPNGFIVIIDHEVRTDIGYCFAYRTTINNTLTIPATTFGHNLGLVDGSGTLVLNGGNLPAGNFSSFLNCPSGGTLEYSGTGNYTIIATQFNTVPALFLSGTGFRYLPNRDLTICRRLVIDGPTLDNTLNNKSLIIGGTLERYNSGTFLSGSGLGATVSFQGTTVQHLGGALGSFDGVNGFNNLEINNTHGLVLGNGIIEVNGNLLLTEGIISTSATDRLIINNQSSTCVIPSGGKSTSFINGPLTKSIPSAASFVFPLGTGTTFGHALTVTAGTGMTTQWTANYVRPNSTSGSFNSPLQAVNADEYWAISSSVARNATVKLGWDIYSAITPLMTQNGISDIRLTDLAAGTWQELSSVTSGDGNNGTVASSGSVSITPTERDFTIAAVTTLKPRASLNPSGPVCGNAGIPVSFTSSSPITLNYTLSYSINGIAQTPVVVSSLPYTLPTSSSGAYRLTGFTYNNGSGTGVVDPRPINVYDIPTTANAGPDQSLCGLSSTTLAANAPAPYSGLWTIVSGTGGTLTNATLYNTTFSGVLGGSYTLRWTISNSSCTSFDEVTISFPVVASRPGNFTASVTPVCQNTTGHIFTVPNVAGQTYNWSYTGTGHTINGTGNSVTIDFGPTATSGTLSVTATNSCGTSVPRTMDITVTPTPVATFSYAGSPYCPNAANALPTFSGGGVAGSFSSTAGLVFANISTGEVNISASTPGTYTVTNTVAAAGGCSVVSATNTITISSVFNWTGAVSTDWNNTGNWSCGIIPTLLTDVIIPNVSNKPVISSGLAGGIRNLTVAAGSSLTISGNTLRIAGTISNSGTITATAGTIEMNGTSPQSIGSGVFSGGLVQNLIINNASGVTLGGPVGVTGYLRVVSGDLASAGNLTLVSTASGTAYIDGTGSGQVTGNVNMERYLPSTFGYRYISSPFQAATISQLSDEINLAASFPPVYRYDESRTTSGWVSYVNPVNVMNPLQGFSVNFGNVSAAGTFDITGVVNNGPLSVTLYNHDNTYTRGLNLIGNPYPSPIDWDAASGWTKTNIDDALYYFKPGATDQYVGTYSSYINGISSDGIVSNIIPSMQAVFIHVSDGAFPVTGILSLNNQVRSGNTSQSFSKSGEKGNRQMVRLSAVFESDTSKTDKMLIYLDDKGTAHFEKTLDALKLMNTDLSVPNIYSLSLENSKLSISAISESSDDLVQIPLGVKANKDGTLRVKISEINDFYPGYNIYFYDNVTGISRSLLYNGSYSVFLPKGEYMTRFFLNISRLTTGTGSDQVAGKEFSVWLSEGVLKADIRQLKGGKGEIFVSNMAGQILYTRRIDATGYQEFDMSLTNGIYMVTLVTGNQKITRKLIVNR